MDKEKPNERREEMRRRLIVTVMAGVLSVVVAAALLGCGPNTQTSASDNEPKADANKSETYKEEAKIESAMSAAPMAIAKDATIVDYPSKAGQPLIELREGTNGWTCFPDWQATPGNDPQCFDKMWMQWNDALMGGTEPNITSPGIAYMLQGGSDASNTDPFAMKPPKGEEWLSTGPHIMLIVPGKLDRSVFSTEPHSGEPWIMWAGTPYEHLMVPVEEETK
jgi:hypothetical protein